MSTYSLHKKLSKNPTSYLCNKLEKWTSNLCDKIQFAKPLYKPRLVANFTGNCNSKIYNYIYSLSNSDTIPSIFLNTASATSDPEKADLFNTFFYSVYKPTLSNPSLPPPSEPTLTSLTFHLLNLMYSQLYHHLIQLSRWALTVLVQNYLNIVSNVFFHPQ